MHWYLEANQCLIYWMHLSNSSERSRHFVLYDLPPPGRLPTRLLKCVELFIQREYSMYGEDSKTDQEKTDKEWQKDELAGEQNKPFAFEGLNESLKRMVGIFRGTGRRTTYDPVHRNVTEDVTFPYSQITYFIQEANESVVTEGQGAVEPPLFSLTIPVISTNVVTGVVYELLRQEDLHLQAAEEHANVATLKKRIALERRWRQRLCRKYKRSRISSNVIDDSLVTPVASHKAAFHLGLSVSGGFFSENDSYWSTPLCNGELGERVDSLQTLSSGLWMFTRAGETIFIPSSRQVKLLTEDVERPNHKRKAARTGNATVEVTTVSNGTTTVASCLSVSCVFFAA